MFQLGALAFVGWGAFLCIVDKIGVRREHAVPAAGSRRIDAPVVAALKREDAGGVAVDTL